jgi:uncharacterized protein (DUF362 family)
MRCPGSSLDPSRRDLFRRTLAAAAAASLGGRAVGVRGADTPARGPTRVALTHGEDHAGIVFNSLAHLKDEIARAIGDRPVVIKPNNVVIDRDLAVTPAPALEGILEFLRSIGKAKDVVIAESAANGPTLEGFSNYGYEPLARKYGARLVDLDRSPTTTIFAVDQGDMRPKPIRAAQLLMNRDVFLISAAKFKTHDRVVATLSLKNIVVGAPVKDPGFRWGNSPKGAKNDKPLVHGDGFHGLQYNLFALAPRLRPDLAVIDGYQGMEGNGPVGGTPVEHRVAVASLDWLAADRLAVALMGIDVAKMGYLNYCAAAGMGELDLARMEVLGEPVARHVKSYRLADNVADQLKWMEPLRA